MNFVDAIERKVAWKTTENGQPALKTTFDANLDLFSTIGALRNRTEQDIQYKISQAYNENPNIAIKCLFYARDIEEGLGERRTFRIGLKYLANFHPQDVRNNLDNIVKFGRYDDLYVLDSTKVEKEMYNFLKKQFVEDLQNYKEKKQISLLAKWLKSVNTSSGETNKLGKKTAKYFGLTEREYRKSLSLLRAYINVLEQKMSANKWESIDFTTVPGGAMKKYLTAFYNHQNERFTEYINAVKEGKKVVVKDENGKEKVKQAKINTKKLYPYEILKKYDCLYHAHSPKEELEVMWKNLKDWIGGEEFNGIVMADTSGSMTWGNRPIDIALSLAIYFAERNTGPYHNKFMTFSTEPSWVSLKDTQTLAEKIATSYGAYWNGTTDLEKAFDLILRTAIQYKIPQNEIPKSLIIITDMEINCVENREITFFKQMQERYANYGYELPEVVFWNVNARNDTFHADKYEGNVRMVSGATSSIFKDLINGTKHNPYDFMLEVLNKERYNCIRLPLIVGN